MRKKKRIAELMEKLEEISKINEALLLENAEQKARLKTAEDELAKAEVEKVADETDVVLNEDAEVEAENIAEVTEENDEEADEDIFEETVEDDVFGETDDGEDIEDEETLEEPQEMTDLEKIVQIIKSADIREQILEALDAKPEIEEDFEEELEEEFEEEIEEEIEEENFISDEIESLKSRSDKIEAELSEIKQILLQKNNPTEEPEKKEETPISEVNPAITKNIGKLIIDAQMGAKRIIDQAKNEAEEYLQKARQDADLIVSQAEFRSRNIYKGFCDAETEIDQIIMKMEDLSEQIQVAKRALKN